MIELDLTPTALIQRSGGFVTAGVAGQTVQLRASDEWQGLRLNLRFSDGWHVRDVTAGSDGSAEIPLDVISAPWRSLSMSVAGFDADGRRVLGPVRCKLGYTMPEGALASGGGGGGGADLSAYLTKSEAQRTYATQTALGNKPETRVTRASNSGLWGSESAVTVSQASGGSLQLVKRVDRVGADTKTTLTLDGVRLATAADLPDTSAFVTRADMEQYIKSLDGTNVGF